MYVCWCASWARPRHPSSPTPFVRQQRLSRTYALSGSAHRSGEGQGRIAVWVNERCVFVVAHFEHTAKVGLNKLPASHMCRKPACVSAWHTVVRLRPGSLATTAFHPTFTAGCQPATRPWCAFRAGRHLYRKSGFNLDCSAHLCARTERTSQSRACVL